MHPHQLENRREHWSPPAEDQVIGYANHGELAVPVIVTRVHRVAGLVAVDIVALRGRPFMRHHSASHLTGGQQPTKYKTVVGDMSRFGDCPHYNTAGTDPDICLDCQKGGLPPK